ncbi:MAG: hypothetical protein WCP28_20075 [Actinomycetes bacterium]
MGPFGARAPNDPNSLFTGIHQQKTLAHGAAYYPMDVKTKPGWMSVGGQGATPEYRWPVIDVGPGGPLKCTKLRIGASDVQLSHISAGNAFTMCGRDFEAWTKTWLPAPPPPYGPPTFRTLG